MESNITQQIRIQAYDSYEHHPTKPTFDKYKTIVTKLCYEIGLNPQINVPPPFLKQLPTTKIQGNRYKDKRRNKIVQFPRKFAFEIEYCGILVFSKLKMLKFPSQVLVLKSVLINLKTYASENLEMKALQDYKITNSLASGYPPKCLYEQVLKNSPKNISKECMNQTFQSILAPKNQIQKIPGDQPIPYCRYTAREKSKAMASIYSSCGQTTRETSKKQKISLKRQGKENIGNPYKKSQELFNLVRMGTNKQKKSINTFYNYSLQKCQSHTKSLYCSIFDSLKIANQFLIGQKKNQLNNKVKLVQEDEAQDKPSSISSQSSMINIIVDETDLSLELTSKEGIKTKNNLNDNLENSDYNIDNNERSKLSSLFPKKQQYVQKREVSTHNVSIQFNQGELANQQESSKNQHTSEANSQLESDQIEEQKEEQLQEALQMRKKEIEISWQTNKQQFNQRHPAILTERFGEKQNFDIELVNRFYSERKIEEYENLLQFSIRGNELLEGIKTMYLREIYTKDEIKLFPNIFKEVEGSSNLAMLVNMMMESNPITISQIFENKKSIDPDGIYCLWLRNPQKGIQPVFVNDEFAVYSNEKLQEILKGQFNNFVYGRLCNENSIWFMVLEKAVAKVLGGYHKIIDTSLGSLMEILMCYPATSFSNLTIEKSLKVFQQKNFHNKLVNFYAKTCMLEDKLFKPSIDRVIGFELNLKNYRNSTIVVKSKNSTLELYLFQFLLNYGDVVLSMYNSSFLINQATFHSFKPFSSTLQTRLQYISCSLQSFDVNNLCYLMFSFGEVLMIKPCRVVIYRVLRDQEIQIVDGMNPLSQQRRKYSYIGELRRYGNFFFECELQMGNYLLVMQLSYEQYEGQSVKPHLATFSQKKLKIVNKSISVETQAQPQEVLSKKKKNRQAMKIKTPKVIIQSDKLPKAQYLQAPKRLLSRKNILVKKQFMEGEQNQLSSSGTDNCPYNR